MFAVTFSAETTFELRLNPAAFKLPLVTLPDTEITVPVTLVVLTLPLVTLPAALIRPSVSKLPV